MSTTTQCLRCKATCRKGTPDPKARAIVASDRGYCSNCMTERFLTSIEPIRNLINGTTKKKGLGPEIFLNEEWREKTFRPVMAAVLGHTQMPEDSINWIEVVSNWGMPWPDGKQPELF